MSEKRFHPYIMGTEHLGDYIVRFHFAGRVVRDVDLRAVLSTEELAELTAGPRSIGDIRTTVMWPNGLHISPEMLDLIYAGFGERKGWPKTVPPVDPNAPFPVPPLQDIGVTKIGGGDPARFVLSSSGASWRTRQIDALFESLRRNVERLVLWWEEAREQLPELSEAEDRRRTLSSGLADVTMTRMALQSLEQDLRYAASGDALVTADEDVRTLVAEATRWNEVWVAQQIVAAADIIDPLENPRGFCEELRARLSAGTSPGEAPTGDSAV